MWFLFCNKKIEFDEFHKDHFYNHVRRTIYYSLEIQHHIINKYYYSAKAKKVNQGVDCFAFHLYLVTLTLAKKKQVNTFYYKFTNIRNGCELKWFSIFTLQQLNSKLMCHGTLIFIPSKTNEWLLVMIGFEA